MEKIMKLIDNLKDDEKVAIWKKLNTKMDFLIHSYWTKDDVIRILSHAFYNETEIKLEEYFDLTYDDFTEFINEYSDDKLIKDIIKWEESDYEYFSTSIGFNLDGFVEEYSCQILEIELENDDSYRMYNKISLH